jgi:hypothetical protein
MELSSLSFVVLLAAVAVLVIVRQFQDRPIRALILLGAPVGLIALGSKALTSESRTGAVLALLVVDLALALGFGVWRGTSFRVWIAPDGQARRQGTRLTLVLWLISIAARGGMTAAGRLAGSSRNAAYQELPVALGLTLLAQAIVILWRASQLAA